MKLRAPYNFVPLSQEGVFHPDWAENISLDIPFKDGITGVIEVSLKSVSPIFVRNGLSKMEVSDESDRPLHESKYNRFNHIVGPDGRPLYFIPGSSVKGLLRSTVEIISNGKFAQVENQSFGKRDPKNVVYRSTMQNCSCGWMYVDGMGDWKIDDHGTAQKVNVALLSCVLPDLMKHIKDEVALRKDANKTARVKYRMLLGSSVKFDDVDFYDNYICKMLSVRYRKGKITTSKGKKIDAVVSVNGSGDIDEGIIVLTGQQGAYSPNKGKDNPGKHHEFIFPSACVRDGLHVSGKVMDAFKTIHVNSEDWTKLWSYQLLVRNQRIPVFFCKDADGNVASIGLASMYKYPCDKSVFDAIKDDFLADAPDLAECMFGYVSKGNDDALKGRVHVGHMFAETSSNSDSSEVHKLILSTPHPSYYPLYVQGGKTWDEAVEVNGRKFYPIRKDNSVRVLPDNENPAVVVGERGAKLVESAVAMIPLAAGTVFKGKIRFFNLKPFELGALVSALTLFNDSTRFHSIGMGKPLGYGKISVTVEGISVYKNDKPETKVTLSVDDCIEFFTKKYKAIAYDYAAWYNSEVNKEFTAMTRENDDIDSYMVMTTNAATDEFRLLKQSRGLPRFTERTKGPEMRHLSPGRYTGEIVSRRQSNDKKTWRYAVSIDGHPDIILRTLNVPAEFMVEDPVSVNVVKDFHSDSYIIKGVFKL